MCMGGTPKPPKPAPPPPPPPPPPTPTVLQTAASEGSTGDNTQTNTKGRKALRIDLTNSNVGGPSGLNLPM